jgi:predicted nucleotide-binding protein (sugar kinase/HSP70/actin superfamily)
MLRRIGVETRLNGYKYFEIERDFLNKLGVLVMLGKRTSY